MNDGDSTKDKSLHTTLEGKDIVTMEELQNILPQITQPPSFAALYARDDTDPLRSSFKVSPLAFYRPSARIASTGRIKRFQVSHPCGRFRTTEFHTTNSSQPYPRSKLRPQKALSRSSVDIPTSKDDSKRQTRRSHGPRSSHNNNTLEGSSAASNLAASFSSSITIKESQRLARCTLTSKVPVEVFELIAAHLTRTDVKNMRLVDKAFERGVSGHLFETVVVPFTTEIYGALAISGGRARQLQSSFELEHEHERVEAQLHADWTLQQAQRHADWTLQQALERQRQDLDIFRGFGRHIRRFGLSFEVSAFEIAIAGPKQLQTNQIAYWGKFKWPFPDYHRYKDRADLEATADETNVMKVAFESLNGVQHLALSMNDGLGWLSGPDLSIRSRLLSERPHTFSQCVEPKTREIRKLWLKLRREYQSLRRLSALKMSEFVRLEQPAVSHLFFENEQQTAVLGPDMFRAAAEAPAHSNSRSSAGIIFTRQMSTMSNNGSIEGNAGGLCPQHLSPSQREWLMETAWAQDAFLSSYIVCVADSKAFKSVRTLTLSPFPSTLLAKLIRDDFWNALPSVSQLEILVEPAWRRIERHSGDPLTPQQAPSKAVDPFYHLLESMIAPRKAIKSLTIGWSAGGEHAEGLSARNKHLMPAPVTKREWCLYTTGLEVRLLRLPNVEFLQLQNSWLAPKVLQAWVRQHVPGKVRSITLESVSLTADPNTNRPAANGPGIWQQMVQQVQLQVQHTTQQIQQLQAANPGIHGPHWAPTPQQLVQQINWGNNLTNLANPIAAGGQQNQNMQTSGFREGSWPTTLSTMKATVLKSGKSDLRVSFVSCGYALLDHAHFDQTALQIGELTNVTGDRDLRKWFERRIRFLKDVVMQTDDNLLGKIACHIPIEESVALERRWHLIMGWPDYDTDNRQETEQMQWSKWGSQSQEAAEFDGVQRGGTGRFSGAVVFEPARSP